MHKAIYVWFGESLVSFCPGLSKRSITSLEKGWSVWGHVVVALKIFIWTSSSRQPVAFGVFTETWIRNVLMHQILHPLHYLQHLNWFKLVFFVSVNKGRVLMRSKCCVQIWEEQLQMFRYGRCNSPMTLRSVLLARWNCNALTRRSCRRHGNIMPAIGGRDGRGSITSNNSDLLPLFGAKSGLMGLIRAGCPIRARGGTGSWVLLDHRSGPMLTRCHAQMRWSS